MKYIVCSSAEHERQGLAWYLRGTTWAGSTDRADKFDTPEAAMAALQRAKKFSKAKSYRHWFVKEFSA